MKKVVICKVSLRNECDINSFVLESKKKFIFIIFKTIRIPREDQELLVYVLVVAFSIKKIE